MALICIYIYIYSGQPEVMLLLLQTGADVNALNTSQCSALHIAINKQHVHCVRVLLQYNCDVNVQVYYG
jgi:E3 ubiquitin-protein ligase mind-bomb